MTAASKRTKNTHQTESHSSSPEDLVASDAGRREQIERRAYEIYLERGGAHGQDLEDWLQAERELEGSSE